MLQKMRNNITMKPIDQNKMTSEKEEKLYEELGNFEFVKYRMKQEGFDYCFKHYSSFEEIQDDKFHELRKKYLDISNELEEYVHSKIDSIQTKIDELED